MRTLTLTTFCALALILGGTALSQDAKKEDEKYRVTPTRLKAGSDEVLIPKDLDAALKELDHMLTPQLREEMRKGKLDDMSEYHFGLGMWMRNNWGLWKGSTLSKWFNQQGIYHPDDMSGVILTSYWRSLNNQPIDLEAQVKYYQDYWKQAAEESKQEKRRVVAAKQKIRAMMLGLKVSATPPETVSFPKEIDGSFRVRYVAPFQGGLILTAKTFSAETIQRKPDFILRTAFYDLHTGVLHPVKTREGDRVEDAVVIGSSAFLNCKNGKTRRILQVSGGQRRFIPLPEFARDQTLPVRLGIEHAQRGHHAALLAVGSRTVARWTGRGWTTIWVGTHDLPPCALPAQRFEDNLLLRDEGWGENDKRLYWQDLSPFGALTSFDEQVGVVGSSGPRWEHVWDYAVARDGTIWISAGSEAASLVRRSPDKRYRVALFHAAPIWSEDILQQNKVIETRYGRSLAMMGLEAQPDGSLEGVSAAGLFTIREGKIIRGLRFGSVHKTPNDWDWKPDNLLTLSPTLKFVSDGFGGMVLLQRDPQGRTKPKAIGPESRMTKKF